MNLGPKVSEAGYVSHYDPAPGKVPGWSMGERPLFGNPGGEAFFERTRGTSSQAPKKRTNERGRSRGPCNFQWKRWSAGGPVPNRWSQWAPGHFSKSDLNRDHLFKEAKLKRSWHFQCLYRHPPKSTFWRPLRCKKNNRLTDLTGAGYS